MCLNVPGHHEESSSGFLRKVVVGSDVFRVGATFPSSFCRLSTKTCFSLPTLARLVPVEVLFTPLLLRSTDVGSSPSVEAPAPSSLLLWNGAGTKPGEAGRGARESPVSRLTYAGSSKVACRKVDGHCGREFKVEKQCALIAEKL